MGCLVQVCNGIEVDTVGRQFEPYRWRPCYVTSDNCSRSVMVIKLRRSSALPAQTPRLGGCSAVASMSVTAGPGRPRAALVCQVTAVTQTVKTRFPSHSQAHCSHQAIRNQASTTPDSDLDVPVHASVFKLQ